MSSHRGRPASHPTDAHGLVACPGPSSLAPLAGSLGRGEEEMGPAGWGGGSPVQGKRQELHTHMGTSLLEFTAEFTPGHSPSVPEICSCLSVSTGGQEGASGPNPRDPQMFSNSLRDPLLDSYTACLLALVTHIQAHMCPHTCLWAHA